MIKITDLTRASPETITLQSYYNKAFDLSSHNRYLLSKDGLNTLWKTTKRYLTGILSPNQSLTISKSFSFNNNGACIGLFYLGQQLDERCYTPTIVPKDPKSTTGDNLTGEEETIEDIPLIRLISLLPNPSGKDDRETIIISNT